MFQIITLCSERQIQKNEMMGFHIQHIRADAVICAKSQIFQPVCQTELHLFPSAQLGIKSMI